MMLLSISEQFYKSLIYDDRYKYILTGLGNTIIMAICAVLIGALIGLIIAIIRTYHDNTNKSHDI